MKIFEFNKKYILLIFMVGSAMSANTEYIMPEYAPYEPDMSKVNAKKPLTFLVYMSADNSLYSYAQGDLNEMMKIGSNHNITILVYLNIRYPGQPKMTKKLVIQKGSILQDGPTEQNDGGSPATLFKALEWAGTNFPSNRFAVVLWDHGSGSLNRILGTTIKQEKWWTGPKNERAICYDDTTGSFLTDSDLRNALDVFCTYYRDGKKIDIVAFDACLMADIEVAYTIAPYANFMVASQQTIPGSGYGYDLALAQAAAGVNDPAQFAKNMVAAYEQEYDEIVPDYTLSALDLDYLNSAVVAMDIIADQLAKMLSSEDKFAVKNAIMQSIEPRYCLSFDSRTYIDIVNFYNNLGHAIAALNLKNNADKSLLLYALKQGIISINDLVIAHVQGPAYPKACGLSVYFEPHTIDATYPGLIWSQDTRWLSFLQRYIYQA